MKKIRMLEKAKLLVVGGSLAILIGIVVAVQAAWVLGDGWHNAAGRNPTGLTEGAVPFEHVDLNPLGIYESEIGRTLSGISVMKADASEHMGIPRVNTVVYASLVGVWLDELWRSTIPGVHMHASDGVVTPTRDGATFAPGEAQMAAARQKVKAAVQRSYRLDPGNPQAVLILAWSRMETESAEKIKELEELARYSMSVLARDLELWPEHSLSIGAIETDIWHMRGRPMGPEAIGGLSERVKANLLQAEETKARLEAQGVWQKRSQGTQEWYDQTHHFLTRFTQMADDYLAEKKKTADPSTN